LIRVEASGSVLQTVTVWASRGLMFTSAGGSAAFGEATGVHGVRGIERLLPDGVHGRHAMEPYLGGGEEREPGMMMVVVVPPEERLKPCPRMKGAQVFQRDPGRAGLC
jgi:hypothetical protein